MKRRGARKGEVVKAILSAVGAAGLLAVAALAPAALQILGALALYQSRYNRRRYFESAIGRLKTKGLIEFRRNHQGILCTRLTERGRAELSKYGLAKLTLSRPKRWDGKYRLVIFDIKEWKRRVRDRLREWLEHLGFVRLQNSVWVYPFECREEVALLKAHFRIGKEVIYLVADKIEDDKWLRREFGLK